MMMLMMIMLFLGIDLTTNHCHRSNWSGRWIL